MKIVPTSIDGAWLIEMQPVADERGYFCRTFCKQEFAKYGMNGNVAQCSISFNEKKGTVRGMHWQFRPGGESKLVRCSHGAVCDVIVDVRSKSQTRFACYQVELTDQNNRMLFVPEGVAHGFQTLKNNSVVSYQISEPYQPGLATGFRWNDPLFNINWPLPVSVISDRDREFPDFAT